VTRALAAALAGLAVAGGSWRTVADRAGAFTIAVPKSWQIVPVSDAALENRVVRLQRQKRLALAAQYASVAASRRGAGTFRFEAFAWPAPAGPIVPDVAVRVDRVAATATLGGIASGYVRSLSAPRGAVVLQRHALSVPAGSAYEVRGTVPVGGTKHTRSAYDVYLLLRRARLYSISLRDSESRLAADAPLMRRVVWSFRFR
jgi:hypothetical protein